MVSLVVASGIATGASDPKELSASFQVFVVKRLSLEFQLRDLSTNHIGSGAPAKKAGASGYLWSIWRGPD